MENKKINNLILNKTAKEFYNCINDSCPICNRKFITPSNIVKLGNVAYDMECYFNATKNGIIIK